MNRRQFLTLTGSSTILLSLSGCIDNDDTNDTEPTQDYEYNLETNTSLPEELDTSEFSDIEDFATSKLVEENKIYVGGQFAVGSSICNEPGLDSISISDGTLDVHFSPTTVSSNMDVCTDDISIERFLLTIELYNTEVKNTKIKIVNYDDNESKFEYEL